MNMLTSEASNVRMNKWAGGDIGKETHARCGLS